MRASFDLSRFPVHLGLGSSVEKLPAFTGEMAWYEEYGQAHAKDGAEGRLVTIVTFERSWPTWEAHPCGEELVVCLSGRITFHQQLKDQVKAVTLEAKEALINPTGVWHTADVDEEASVLFITAGKGTELRPR